MKLEQSAVLALDRIADSVMREANAVGMAVSAFDSDGQVFYERFLGFRNQKEGLPLDQNTVMGLASVTKSFTALSVWQLCDRGLIDVFAPVRRYVPEFGNPGIMVWHLLSHSAGFYPIERLVISPVMEELGLSHAKDGEMAYNLTLAEQGTKRLIERLNAESSYNGRPGEHYSYSNDGFALLGEIVRRVSGEPTYAAYLKKHVLGPLDMERSGCDFVWNDPNVTTLYQQEGDRMRDDYDFYDLAFALMGEGNMRASISDMRKYVGMYLNRGRALNGARLASAYAVREMTKPRQISGLNEYYGYGLSVKPTGDITVITHGGNLTGVSSEIAWSYETGVGVVVLSNTSGTPVSRLGEAVMRAAAGQPVEQAEKAAVPVAWPEAFLNKVCGVYQSREGLVVTIENRGGRPHVLLGDEPIEAVAINRYMLSINYKGLRLNATICQDEDGEVWAIELGRIVPKIK